jgi:hypothetical protein
MNRRPNSSNALARALGLLLGACALTVAIAAEPPARVRGTIVSASADSVSVQTAQGQVNLAVDAATKIAGIVPSSPGQIKEGSFVGIANVTGSGMSSALEVVVFPEAMRGSGLGDYPWDLSGPVNGGARTSAMTNGTVKSSSSSGGMMASTSAMTNGTVKKTANANGLVLTVDYGKGEKTIDVAAGVPVVTIVPADASKLLKGAHVFIATKKDAPTSAAFIAVGIDGTVPPM